jgi:hypothetical protein
MLQWQPRLIALLIAALAIASALGLGDGRGFSWR